VTGLNPSPSRNAYVAETAGPGFPERNYAALCTLPENTQYPDASLVSTRSGLTPCPKLRILQRTSEELKQTMMYVLLTKQESHVIAELARREARSKSNMLRALILEALRARAFGQTSS